MLSGLACQKTEVNLRSRCFFSSCFFSSPGSLRNVPIPSFPYWLSPLSFHYYNYHYKNNSSLQLLYHGLLWPRILSVQPKRTFYPAGGRRDPQLIICSSESLKIANAPYFFIFFSSLQINAWAYEKTEAWAQDKLMTILISLMSVDKSHFMDIEFYSWIDSYWWSWKVVFRGPKCSAFNDLALRFDSNIYLLQN